MEDGHWRTAETARSLIERGLHDPATFRAALLSVPPLVRDDWLNCVLGLGELPEDDPALPLGCVPYLPCSVDAIVRIAEQAPVHAADVFVDVGSGLGRAAVLVHLLTGAEAIGIEVQPALVRAARDLALRLNVSRVSCVEGDATTLTGLMTTGSVFFLYCPFGGARLAQVLADLEAIARTRTLRICCVDLPLPPCPWLTLQSPPAPDVAIYRSTFQDQARSSPEIAALTSRSEPAR